MKLSRPANNNLRYSWVRLNVLPEPADARMILRVANAVLLVGEITNF